MALYPKYNTFSTKQGGEYVAISIKAARVNAGLTQIDVAKELGKSKNTIVSYESYTTIPDIQTAKAMAKLFKMSVDDIAWSKE